MSESKGQTAVLNIRQDCSGRNTLISNGHFGLCPTLVQPDPATERGSFPIQSSGTLLAVSDFKSSKIFICTKCGKSFQQHAELMLHLNVHFNQKSFICTHCGKKFTTKYTLANHVRVHTGERPFSCSTCGRSFATKSALVGHNYVHTAMKYGSGTKTDNFDNESFVCSECEQHFSLKDDFMKNQNTHNPTTFLCFLCGKHFATKANLVSHKMNHRHEKPFSCPTFITQSTHERSHILVQNVENVLPRSQDFLFIESFTRGKSLIHALIVARPFGTDRLSQNTREVTLAKSHIHVLNVENALPA
ncbi:hypothetical protein AB205_0031030, partial [Aquarana catesbeiana]